MITVIISTYKREPSMLARAINSVLCQTYRDIEIIIVDDSPDDYTYRHDVEKMVLQYKENQKDIEITYIPHNQNLGACAARNTGLYNSKGEYIAYLDDDDEWLPDKLEKQLNVLLSSNADLVYCGNICTNDTTGNSKIEKKEYCRGVVFKKLLYRNFIGSTSFPLIISSCLKNVGGFDEQMQSAQDYDVWLKIAEKYIIDYVAEPLVIYHEHDGEQITSDPVKKISGLERIVQKYSYYLDKNASLWYRRHIIIAPYYALAGNREKAKQIWRECACKCPWKIIDNIKYIRIIMRRKINKSK